MDDFLKDIVDCFNETAPKKAKTAEEALEQLDQIIDQATKD